MNTHSDPSKATRYWRNNLCLIGILLAIWAIVTFIPAYYARALTALMIFGWPFPFWMAAFGAPTAFLLIIGVYAWFMERQDQRRRVAREVERFSDNA